MRHVDSIEDSRPSLGSMLYLLAVGALSVGALAVGVDLAQRCIESERAALGVGLLAWLVVVGLGGAFAPRS